MKTFGEYYAQKDFAKAEEILQQHRKDIPEGLWHFNLGTVKAKTQEWAQARYHFMRAQREGISQEKTQQNLLFVETQLDSSRLEAPVSTSDYLVKAGLMASGGALMTLSLIILVLGLWVLRKTKDYRAACLYAVLITLPFVLNWWISSWPQAIVTESQRVSEGPSAIFPARIEIPAGTLVVGQRRGEWWKVIYPSRYQGWIKTEVLQDLEKSHEL